MKPEELAEALSERIKTGEGEPCAACEGNKGHKFYVVVELRQHRKHNEFAYVGLECVEEVLEEGAFT